MSAVVDVAILSLATTLGWRRADAWLAAGIRGLGYSCSVVPVSLGAAGGLRRSMLLTDLVEALAARRSAGRIEARSVICSSITASLLQAPEVPYAIRFDSLAALSRPGAGGAWQRRREPAVLSRATLLLPWSETAADAARVALSQRSHPEIITLPVPIESPTAGAHARPLDAIAYAGNPDKRGLDVLVRAWDAAAPPGGELTVGGIDPDDGIEWLSRRGIPVPAGIRWVGVLPHERWLALVASARIFLSTSRYEDWGIAQLEALAAGTPLVSVPTPGPNEALALAQRLAPALLACTHEPEALAAAIQAGLAMDGPARAGYAAAAARLLEPYRPDAVVRTLAERVLPALLPSSA